ncbi:receptor-type tyrosine-protein phosphatase kappa-like [Pecten maximus]|uniref:receptor-type tyrosine-protein phosphatase kappa-like n=1 Tax=Pecten maximus TaxID=6579 RepID=UPI00145807B8|nr:receptor-type tyrosine-protein phosphatase kappa-like [Pecten maximus]
MCAENCTKCAQDGGQCLVCNDGFYGTSCTQTCGQCESNHCDVTSGNCETCQPDWTGQRCDVKVDMQTTDINQSEDEESYTWLYIVIGVGIVVVLVLSIVCVVKRRTTTPRDSTLPSIVKFENSNSPNNQTNPAGEEQGHVLINIGTTESDPIEGPVGISVTMLKTMIVEKMADEEKEFISEFNGFPTGSCHPHTAAEINKSKDRFKSIHPYDHSRVILDSVGKGSDYINANYIDNVEASKVYVATQGPILTTIDDFWRMVWKLNSGKIVMLTNLIEKEKTKCEKYWPDEGEPMSTKTFYIMQNRERDYASHVVRNITVVDRKTKEKRDIYQFHFTTWPDHGTPNTLELVLLHRRVKLTKSVLPGQMVIHCSAGIGRTGTFIALDALFDYGKRYNRVDIPQFVTTMRKDRMCMIQTLEQYVALHEILAEAFDLQETLIPKSTFVAKYHDLASKGQPQNQTQLRDEFRLMLDLKPDYKLEQDFLASTLPQNVTKNRTMEILAADRYRPFLTSYTSNGNDYINAVVTQSYIARSGYIVTQFPLPNTRVDFWTLMMDYQCDSVVILGDENDSEPDTQWIPANKEDIDIGDFNVKQKGTSTEFNGVGVIDLAVTRKNVKAVHNSRIFRMKEWTAERNVPPSKQSTLHLLEQVESRRRSSGSKPVVVMCRDGSTQCGLFCLMANTRDQLKMDEEVDVFQAARQLLIRQPEFLATFDQYEFCYAILNDYLETTDVYIN